ncbi:MAG: PRC-barrel domain containing protein [Solirubrobacterales bacterium]|nr:PRC-barrel domain containing protein [Solirubrobacterales bacterium]
MLVEQVEQWIGCEVVDRDGVGVGKLTEVYFRGSEPVLVATKGGLLTRKRQLIPLEGSSASRNHVRIAFAADRLVQTKGGGDELDARDLAAVAEHYGNAHLAEPGELESSRARGERLRVAAEAEQRASRLEAEAQQRELDAEDATARAQAAQKEARAALDRSGEVDAQARAARDQARRL